MDKNEIKKWVEENCVRYSDAHYYTKQTKNQFVTTASRKYVEPFITLYDKNVSKSKTTLYLKEDLIRYGEQLEGKRTNKQKE
ncbi:hypothetical protein KYI13_12670 (plasmid) [Macrococcoides bohemicum]|uniref:hypothetical protein n=1 Tax=Macrococcoides bohemicum TaxID=1903056 RepID=UPI001C5F112F|nr:hypothetical protein [Macrococcus bohemicus]QYA46035.1 hypothetical protein KYI13_12670 [Macrococcus bohemicus]